MGLRKRRSVYSTFYIQVSLSGSVVCPCLCLSLTEQMMMKMIIITTTQLKMLPSGWGRRRWRRMSCWSVVAAVNAMRWDASTATCVVWCAFIWVKMNVKYSSRAAIARQWWWFVIWVLRWIWACVDGWMDGGISTVLCRSAAANPVKKTGAFHEQRGCRW